MSTPAIDLYPNMPDWAKAKLAEFVERLATMSNQELIDQSGQAILGAAVMAGRRSDTGLDDAKASACAAEARRRGNEDLYQRGYNSAVRSQGHRDMVRPVSTPISVGEPAVA